MFSLTRNWPKLCTNINIAPLVGGGINANTNNINSIRAQYHWLKMHSAEQITPTMVKKYQRTLSTLRNHSEPLAARVTLSKDESREFMAVFPDVVRELAEIAKQYGTQEAASWFTRALEYNVPLGKKNRGLLAVLTYKNLVRPEELTAENLKLIHYLSWYVEMLQCFFIIADDIMDNSTTRRGQLCWHKLEEVGVIANNDALMIENGIFQLLRKHFRHLDCYVDLLELFHEVSFITICGQSLDLLNANKNVNTFTMEQYNSIVTSKTSYYTFYLPVALAFHMAGVEDPETFRQSKAILMEMGHLFQVQDDFLDCFGNTEITGKIGTDIQDNKCSWLAVMCMQRASPEQKVVMAECYGKNDSVKIARVKQLYEELDIAGTYAAYEEEKYQSIKALIQQTTAVIPQEIFLQILNKIYHRNS